METSILIVTKNRPDELEITLKKLFPLIDLSIHEVLIFIDGCKKTFEIINKYSWVQWQYSDISISASPARNKLYKNAKGKIIIGLDDDAHPLSKDFISKIQKVFIENYKIGIIAFQEIRGVFLSDENALENANSEIVIYNTNDFIGCGFAIKKEVYDKTNGFPIWIDIYGEEPCLSIEVMDLGYEIQYNNTIIINHRIDIKKRLNQGKNYFRFEKQLKNSIFYYIVYYKNPILKIIKLIYHNFIKYGIKDLKYFTSFCKSIILAIINMFYVLKFRKPVQKITLQQKQKLKGIKY